jgi:hypothetical protein
MCRDFVRWLRIGDMQNRYLMAVAIDFPKSLKSEEERKARQRLIDEPHVARLTAWVRQIRRDTGLGEQIPLFDPLDGRSIATLEFLEKRPSSGMSRRGTSVPAGEFALPTKVILPRGFLISSNCSGCYPHYESSSS